MGVTVKPFRAVRPKPVYASQAAALPYDVMNSEEARQMASGNAYSFLRVDKAEIDLPPGTDPYGTAVYAKAKENLQALMESVMQQDEQPNLYIYRLTGYNRTQTGLAACVSVDEYNHGLIKKHEFTRPDKEQDRINHMLACEAHTGPIFMAYRAQDPAGPHAIMAAYVKNEATYDFTAEDGVRHELWVVDEQAVQNKLVQAFKQVPYLYIADGHHRNAAAVKVAQMRAKQNMPNYDQPIAKSHHLVTDSYPLNDEFNYYLAVIFPHDELAILDYNRVVTDLNGMDVPTFLASLEADWHVEKSTAPVKPARKHTAGMYISGQWYRLTLKNLPDEAEIIGNLDCAVLQNKLLAPLLGIDDPKTDKRIDFVGGIRGLDGLKQRVDSGEMAVAFALYPTSMDELMAVADANQTMPPKSTWFEPKLRSGLLMHLF